MISSKEPSLCGKRLQDEMFDVPFMIKILRPLITDN